MTTITDQRFSNGNTIDHLARLTARTQHTGGRHRAEDIGRVWKIDLGYRAKHAAADCGSRECQLSEATRFDGCPHVVGPDGASCSS